MGGNVRQSPYLLCNLDGSVGLRYRDVVDCHQVRAAYQLIRDTGFLYCLQVVVRSHHLREHMSKNVIPGKHFRKGRNRFSGGIRVRSDDVFGNTRIYYKYLIEKMCPFIREKQREDPDVNFQLLAEFQQFQIWSSEFKKYEESEWKNEEILTSVIECF